jgi:hypothetical protein
MTVRWEPPVNYLQLAGLWPLRAYRLRSIVAVVLPVCPPQLPPAKHNRLGEMMAQLHHCSIGRCKLALVLK